MSPEQNESQEQNFSAPMFIELLLIIIVFYMKPYIYDKMFATIRH